MKDWGSGGYEYWLSVSLRLLCICSFDALAWSPFTLRRQEGWEGSGCLWFRFALGDLCTACLGLFGTYSCSHSLKVGTMDELIVEAFQVACSMLK